MPEKTHKSIKMKLFPKGQVVIPVELRRKYHLEIGDHINVVSTDQGILLKPFYSFFASLEKGETKVELKLIVLFQTVFVLKSYYKVPKNSIATSLTILLKYHNRKSPPKR